MKPQPTSFFPKLKRAGQSGLSQIGTLLTVLILVAGIYIGAQVVPFFIYYYEVQGHFDAMSEKAAFKKDKDIREFLSDQIRKMDLPVEKKDLIIVRNSGIITIELEYQEVLVLDLGQNSDGEDIYFRELWTFKFHPKARKSFKK